MWDKDKKHQYMILLLAEREEPFKAIYISESITKVTYVRIIEGKAASPVEYDKQTLEYTWPSTGNLYKLILPYEMPAEEGG